jgi:transcriptional regulator with XRE-family HTH domain
VDTNQILQRLAAEKKQRREIAAATGLRVQYLNKLIYGEIKKPGAAYIDRLRDYFTSRPQQ